MKRIVCLVVTVPFLCLTGCNREDSLSQIMRNVSRQTEPPAPAHENEEAAKSRLNAERSAMTMRLNLVLATQKGAVQAIERNLAEARADQMELMKRVSALSTSESANFAQEIAALMRDEQINALSLKYLSKNFLLASKMFLEEVEAVRLKQTQRDEALAKSQAELDQVKTTARAHVQERHRSAEKSAEKVQAEIKRLEKRQALLERDLATISNSRSSSNARSDKKRELDVVRTQLERLRSLYDASRSDRGVGDVQARESSLADSQIRRAESAHERRVMRINKDSANLGDLQSILDRALDQTVGRLEAALAKKVDDLRQAQAECEASRVYVKELLPVVPTLDLPALQALSNEIEGKFHSDRADKDKKREKMRRGSR